MNHYIPIILAIVITASLPLVCLFLIKHKLKRSPTTTMYLQILDNKLSTSKQNAVAFCSLINANYIHVMIKTNNGGKYDDERHTKRFEKSVTANRIQRLNALTNKMSAERIPYEHD